MKKEHRAVYLELRELLCSFCRYGLWEGDCCDGYYECKHPLYERSSAFEGMAAEMGSSSGEDCWGFRPCVSWDVAHGMTANFQK